MPSINRTGNSRKPDCCPRSPVGACCMSLGAGSSEYLTIFRSLAGFTVLQFGAGGTATAGPNGLVLTTNPPPVPGGFAAVEIIGDSPVLAPSTDEFCFCFDVNPLFADQTHSVIVGLVDAAVSQLVGVIVLFGRWFFQATGPSATNFFAMGIPAASNSSTKIRICRLPGDPSNTFTVTIDGYPPQQFVVAAGAVPSGPLFIWYNAFAFAISQESPGQIVRSTTFCANFRAADGLGAPLAIAEAPLQSAPRVTSSIFERARQILDLPIA